jgi:hypothetical protein
MAPVIATADVNRPAADVFADATDPARFSEWQKGAVDGPIRAIVDLTVDALTETSSRLTISVDFEGHGIGKALVPLVVRREARKEMPGNLATLKQRLEAP